MTTYTSVAEIFGAIDEARERLYDTLSRIDSGRENFRDAPGRWSVAEIVEHLAIIEGRVGKLAATVLSRAESQGAAPGDGRIASVSPDEMYERSRAEKYEAPEMVRPQGGAPLADSLARLRASRAALQALRPRIEAFDLSAISYPHPAFGPLDLYHWLLFLGLHEERHRRQIESLIDSGEADEKS